MIISDKRVLIRATVVDASTEIAGWWIFKYPRHCVRLRISSEEWQKHFFENMDMTDFRTQAPDQVIVYVEEKELKDNTAGKHVNLEFHLLVTAAEGIFSAASHFSVMLGKPV